MAHTDLDASPMPRDAATDRPAVPTDRIAWVDYARGIAIIFVVIGHVIAGLPHLTITERSLAVLGWLASWIYNFHMPAFFLAAGLFAPASLRKGSRRFLIDKAATVVYPYFVWGIGQTLIQIVLSRYSNNLLDWHDLVRLLYDPPMQFWFLYVLALAFVAYVACAAAGVGAPGLLVLALAVGYLARRSGFSPMSMLNRFGDQAPFFAAGIFIHRYAGDVARAPMPLLVAIALAGGALNTYLIGLHWLPYPASLLVAVPGVVMLVAFSAVVARLGGSATLARLGRWSLEIYLVHVLAYVAARIALQKGLGVTNPFVYVVVGSIAGLAGPVALALAAEKVGFPYLFRWPVRRPASQAPATPG